MSSGKNGTDLRANNRAAILQSIYSEGVMSRKALASRMDLTQAALSIITREMLDEKVLVETGFDPNVSNYKGGRKEICLDIAKSRFYAFGAYIATRDISVFCMDFNYNLKFMKKLSVDACASGEDILNSVFDIVDEYLEKIKNEDVVITGIGIALKGIVDTERGVSVNSFGLWENNLPVYEIARRRFPYRVIINNNVKCIAYAESLLQENNRQKSLLFIKYGPLVGASLVINSNIYDGASYNAMEIGHIVVEPNGVRCRCGKNGCLETVIGFDVMTHQLQLLYSEERVPKLYNITNGDVGKVNMETILQAYEADDPAVCAVMERAINFFSVTISNTIGLLNPDKVILYGRPFQCKKYNANLISRLSDVGCNLDEVDISESTNNMEEDYSSCISIVIKEFIKSGGLD